MIKESEIKGDYVVTGDREGVVVVETGQDCTDYTTAKELMQQMKEQGCVNFDIIKLD